MSHSPIVVRRGPLSLTFAVGSSKPNLTALILLVFWPLCLRHQRFESGLIHMPQKSPPMRIRTQNSFPMIRLSAMAPAFLFRSDVCST